MAETPPILSPSEPIVDRYRRLTDRWYPWFKKLIETLRKTEAATTENAVKITEIAEVTDGLNARWGVEITGSGQVIGLVRLDGNATESTFTILADRFLVAHPTATGVSIQAFGVALVDGVPTVGINGNAIIKGTVTADRMNVTDLSAVTTNFGSGTYSGTLSSPNGRMVIDFSNEYIVMTT